MPNLKYITVAIALLFLLFACGPQDNNKDKPASTQSQHPQIEVGEDVPMNKAQDLLIKANMNSQLQISLSKAAANKSSSPKIKALSNQILTENKLIQNNILALSEAAGIEMEPALSLEYVALLDAVQSYSGDRFDSIFISTIIEEHKEDIEAFTKLSEKADNPITREQITNNLEILERHLHTAKEIRNTMEER